MHHAGALVVDKAGLARKLAHRPKCFALFELISNAWDAPGVTRVDVGIQELPRGRCRIGVLDDAPDGFTDLASVYTMFRDSEKAANPEKRGRFEVGEKLVAALALRMEVATTKGTVLIEGDKRTNQRRKLDRGSQITVELRVTKDELKQMHSDAKRLIAPAGIKTFVNLIELKSPESLHRFEATLETVRADGEGNLRPTQRKTIVEVYNAAEGSGFLYELGIPVVETGDSFSYNVRQRVPVNWERNSVPPAYLRALRVAALNALHAQIPESESALPWVNDALDDARCAPDAVAGIVRKRWGDKVVINDPSDTEGTKLAVSEGYVVIHGNSLSKGAWQHIREHKIVLPAGQVTPSPKPYSPDGEPEDVIPREEWSPDMGCRAVFCEELFCRLQGYAPGSRPTGSCTVVIVNEPNCGWLANFGRRGVTYRLCLNHGRLGHRWFELPHRSVEVLDLLIHEFGHQRSGDHLSAEYHKALTDLGAKLCNLALDDPEFFR